MENATPKILDSVIYLRKNAQTTRSYCLSYGKQTIVKSEERWWNRVKSTSGTTGDCYHKSADNGVTPEGIGLRSPKIMPVMSLETLVIWIA